MDGTERLKGNTKVSNRSFSYNVGDIDVPKQWNGRHIYQTTARVRIELFSYFLILFLFFIYFLFLIKFLVSPWNFAFIKSGYTFVITFFYGSKKLARILTDYNCKYVISEEKIVLPSQTVYPEISNKISQV